MQKNDVPIQKIFLRYFLQFNYLTYPSMGFFGSRQARVLEEGKRIKQDLHQRCNSFLDKYKQEIDNISNEKKNKIIRSTALQLVDLLDAKQITSEEAIFCFSQRVVRIALKHNYILDEMLEEALIESRKCDEERRASPEKIAWKRGKNKNQCFPPFYGVPISVKQTIQMKGKRIYFGVITNFQPIPQDDYLFMQLTRKMGFIPFVRSSAPQGCKTIQTNNNIVGYAKNPWNLQRSTGGSSGGQGGLIASLCSPIGIGTDLGGSLRVPSCWNGICTIKPNGRISRLGDGYSGRLSNGMTVKSTIGFMTKSIEDSIATLAFICDEQNYKTIDPKYLDQYLTLRPFNYKFIDEKPKFRIGVTKHLETLKCSRTFERVVDECSKILQDDGHTLIPVTLKGFEKSFLLLMREMFCDGGSSILDEIRGDEPLTPEFQGLYKIRKMPQFWKKYLISSLKKNNPRQAALLDVSRKMTAKEAFEEIYDVQTVIANQMHNLFIQNNLDVIIMPGFAIPAVFSGQVPRISITYAYTTGWNPLCYPAGVVPVTTVQQGQTVYEDQYNDSFTQAIKDNLKGSEGMPAALQVASTPYNQQKILYIMSQIEKKVKFRQKHPYPQKWD